MPLNALFKDCAYRKIRSISGDARGSIWLCVSQHYGIGKSLLSQELVLKKACFFCVDE